MFRNESREVKRKAQAKSATIRTRPQSSIKSSRPLNITLNLQPSIFEKAVGFFFTHYVTPWSATDYHIAGNLLHSIRAVGLAGILSSVNAPPLKTHAEQEYLEAIRLTNSALSCPVEAKKDSTLLGIIVLSIYEAITGRGEKSIAAWENHLRGAAALLKMRGMSQMHTADGRRLFLQITTTLVTSCIKNSIPLPEHIHDLRIEAEQYADPMSPTWRLHGALIDFADFRAKVSRSLFSDPSEIIAKALEQEQNLISVFSNVSSAWNYSTVYTDADPDIVFAGCYHVYPSFMAAQSWNAIRSIRMLLHSIIIDAAGLLSPEYNAEASRRILLELQSDMLSSVPQHIGYISKQRPSQPHRNLWSNFESVNHDPFSKSGPGDKMTLPDVRLYGGYNLLWNIWSTGTSRITTLDVRKWIVGILQRIGTTMDVQQALVLAELLQKMPHQAKADSPELPDRKALKPHRKLAL